MRNWLSQFTEVVQERLIGEIEDLLDAAAQGRTDPHDDHEPLKPLIDRPSFFELRHALDPGLDGYRTELFRQYHFEPETPWHAHLIALHAHLKWTEGPSSDVHSEQSEVIRYAVQRCANGSSQNWHIEDGLVDPVELLLGPA